jgi:dihydrofolate reductase
VINPINVATMAKLVYSAITSLDGYLADENGDFSWAVPTTELFEYINELERPIGSYLYGRRMYETMVYWETFDGADDASACELDFAAIWKSADKIVFSTSLESVSSTKTRIERRFESESLRRMKRSANSDISIGGANLANQVMAAGLIDEIHLFLMPVTIGGGTAALSHPSQLELLAVERFSEGVVHLHYRGST